MKMVIRKRTIKEMQPKNAERKRPTARVASAQRWGRRLAKSVANVLKKYPKGDPDNVRHTLILLELPPIERLQRSLLRGRASPNRRNAKTTA